MANRNEDSVVLVYNESVLRESDLELLKEPFWLNDTLISFYFDYLQNDRFANNRSLLFISPEVTQCIKVTELSEISEKAMNWPTFYEFPPFFTLQPHAETREKQLTIWKRLILDWHRVNRKYRMDINPLLMQTQQIGKELSLSSSSSSAADDDSSQLFRNTKINRQLNREFICLIMNELVKSKNAVCLQPNRIWQIYWFTLEEWANLLYDYVRKIDGLNRVFTFYELTGSDTVASESFYEMDETVLIEVLRLLQTQNRCELIFFDDNKGVKFY